MPMRPELRRRGALLAAALICAAVCAGCGEVHAQLHLGPPRHVTVAIAGPANGLYASLYVAQADRDFKLGALDVTITQTSDPLRALASGGASIAIVSEPALLAARSGGAALVAIGALVRQPLDGIVSLASRPLSAARELAGRTIVVAPTPLASAELATVLAAAGLPASSVHAITPAGSLEAAVADGQAQAELGDPWPIDAAALAQAHHAASVLEIQQAGVPPYSSLVIAVRLNEAHYDGALLRAFLQSLTRGENAVEAEPGAAAAILARINPRIGRALERAILAQTLPIAAPANTANPFGYQDPALWQSFGAWMHQHALSGAGDAALAIDDEFLPGQGEIVTGGS